MVQIRLVRCSIKFIWIFGTVLQHIGMNWILVITTKVAYLFGDVIMWLVKVTLFCHFLQSAVLSTFGLVLWKYWGLNAIWRGVGFLQLVGAYDLFSNFTFFQLTWRLSRLLLSQFVVLATLMPSTLDFMKTLFVVRFIYVFSCEPQKLFYWVVSRNTRLQVTCSMHSKLLIRSDFISSWSKLTSSHFKVSEIVDYSYQNQNL